MELFLKVQDHQLEVEHEHTLFSQLLWEFQLFEQQMIRCLNLNAGISNLKDLKPVIYIEVNPDRTVKSSRIVNQENMIDSSFRTAAEAALRAVNNPECSPLMLPENKYETWKEVNFTFDFSWMFD